MHLRLIFSNLKNDYPTPETVTRLVKSWKVAFNGQNSHYIPKAK